MFCCRVYELEVKFEGTHASPLQHLVGDSVQARCTSGQSGQQLGFYVLWSESRTLQQLASGLVEPIVLEQHESVQHPRPSVAGVEPDGLGERADRGSYLPGERKRDPELVRDLRIGRVELTRRAASSCSTAQSWNPSLAKYAP